MFPLLKLNQKGLTFIELIVSLAIMAIIISSLIMVTRSMIKNFQQVDRRVRQSQELYNQHPILASKLKHAKKITNVSLSSNDSGYISYIDSNDETLLVFLNTASNQTALSQSNSYPTHCLLVAYTTSSLSTTPEVIATDITKFNIKTYQYKSGISQLSEVNNTITPDYDAINSIKLTITKQKYEHPETAEVIINLGVSEIESSSTVTYGTSGTAFTDSTVTLTEMITTSSTLAVQLTEPTKKVTIKNTGEYYTTINDAINAASDGDIILVSEGTYYENVLLKTGITILGGYESTNWTRDINTYKTKIINPGTGNAGCFYGYYDNNVTIDGFEIDGGTQSNAIGIYGYVCSNLKVSNCWIDNIPNVGVYSYKGSATYENLEVTANTNAFQVYQVTSATTIQRCRFYSEETSWCKNVYLRDSSNITFKNNLVIDGDYGIYVQKSSAANIYLINNIIKDNGYGVYLYGNYYSNMTDIYMFNNIIYNSDYYSITGYYIDWTHYYDIQNNVFSDFGYDYYDYYSDIYLSTYDNTVLYSPSSISSELNSDYTVASYAPNLTDQGNTSSIYDDDGDVTQTGTGANDIGLFGGPSAGRVGVAKAHTVDTSSYLDTVINSTAYPGDHILFEAGTYDVYSTLTVKRNRKLYGQGPHHTILNNQTYYDALFLSKDNHIEGFQIKGDNYNDGIELDSNAENITIEQVLFKDLSIGINDQTANKNTFQFNTFYLTSTGISAGMYSYADVQWSAFVGNGSQTGIDTYSYYVSSKGNVYYDLSSDYSAYVYSQYDQTDSSPTYEILASPNAELYQLHDNDDNEAINRYGNRDSGAFPYDEASGTTQIILTSTLPRHYNKVSIEIEPDSMYPLSEISMSIDSVDIPSNFTVTSTGSTTHDWEKSIIGTNVTFNFTTKSYKYNHTPVISKIKFEW